MSAERKSASFEEIALSNMLMLEALIEQLSQKSLVDRDAILRRVQELKREIRTTPPSTASKSDA
jgi:hypothetical protein